MDKLRINSIIKQQSCLKNIGADTVMNLVLMYGAAKSKKIPMFT